MTRISVGDASLTNILARQGAELRAQVNRAAQETTTGRPVDVNQALRGDLSPLLAIDASLTRLEAFKSATTQMSAQTSAQQSALNGLSQLSGQIATTLMGIRDATPTAQVSAIAADARGRLDSAVGLLNTQAGGRAVFSGTATGTPPLGTSEDLLIALEAAVAGATTAGQVSAAVANWFADPLGFGAFYEGGTPLGAVMIAPGEEAAVSTTAQDPALRDTLAGFALAALLDRGILAGNAEERARLAQTAGRALLTAEDARITLAARIGMVEGQIEAARTRNAAEATALGLARSEIASVDPYEAATRLETAQKQLESLYLITSRVSRLSLVEFLR